MTKDQLQQWLLSMATIMTGLGKWLWGPLAWAKTYTDQAASLFNGLANNDFVLTFVLMAVNQGVIQLHHAAQPAPQQQVAMLMSPSPQHLTDFVDQAPDHPDEMAA